MRKSFPRYVFYLGYTLNISAEFFRKYLLYSGTVIVWVRDMFERSSVCGTPLEGLLSGIDIDGFFLLRDCGKFIESKRCLWEPFWVGYLSKASYFLKNFDRLCVCFRKSSEYERFFDGLRFMEDVLKVSWDYST